MNFMITAEQVGILGTAMLIGFLIVKTGYVKAEVRDAISKLIVRVALPALIISSISNKDLEKEFLGNLFLAFCLSLFCIISLFLLGTLVAKLLRLEGATATVHRLLTSLGNVIFFGYPIIYALYGEMGFFYAIIYWLLNDLFLWTVGVFLFSRGSEKEESVSLFKRLLNPNTISFLIAVLMFVFGIKLPPIIEPAISGIGALTTYLSMIFIGMALATVDVKKAFKSYGVFIVVLLKLIVMPLVFIFIFRLIPADKVILSVIILEAAMPAQTVLTILANDYKSDYEYAAVGMFVTTVASLVTMPVVCYFIETLL